MIFEMIPGILKYKYTTEANVNTIDAYYAIVTSIIMKKGML